MHLVERGSADGWACTNREYTLKTTSRRDASRRKMRQPRKNISHVRTSYARVQTRIIYPWNAYNSHYLRLHLATNISSITHRFHPYRSDTDSCLHTNVGFPQPLEDAPHQPKTTPCRTKCMYVITLYPVLPSENRQYILKTYHGRLDAVRRNSLLTSHSYLRFYNCSARQAGSM